MKARQIPSCVLGFAAGAIAVPVGMSLAAAAPSTTATHGPNTVMQRHAVVVPASGRTLSGRSRAAGVDRFGTVPAKIVRIYDDHCQSFVVAGAAAQQPVPVQPNDPRLQPCTPTANSFVIQWATAPTEAQAITMQRVMGDLALNHPTITLTEAEPLIRAASATVQ